MQNKFTNTYDDTNKCADFTAIKNPNIQKRCDKISSEPLLIINAKSRLTTAIVNYSNVYVLVSQNLGLIPTVPTAPAGYLEMATSIRNNGLNVSHNLLDC